MKRSHTVLLVAAAAALGCSRYLLRARMPDDFDAIGFVLAVDHFDLATFQPHFPGYPVYVALCRVAHLVLPAPLDAASAVSAMAAAATAIGLFCIARAAAPPAQRASAGALAIGLYAASALPWMLGGAARSDGTAAAFLVLACAALLHGEAWSAALGGLAIALMLGTRASYAPLAASIFAVVWLRRREQAWRWLGGAAIGTVAWALPFVLLVGARRLFQLGRVHLAGHFASWGGTIVTRPGMGLRLWAFARGLVGGALSPKPWALLLLAALILVAFVIAVAAAVSPAPPSALGQRLRVLVAERWRPASVARAWAPALPVAILALPYALWALLGQNIIEQPRHLLPLILMLLLALALLFAPRPGLGAAFVLCLLCSSLPLVRARARSVPSGAALAAYLNTQATEPTQSRGQLVIFGGPSMRFVRYLAPQIPVYERQWLSEVDVTLERLDVLPRRVLVTSEVEVDPRRAAHLKKGPSFCAAATLGGGAPCLTIFEYSILDGNAP